MKGDVVTVRKSVGRNMLLAKNRAVYASQENIREFVQERAVSTYIVFVCKPVFIFSFKAIAQHR